MKPDWRPLIIVVAFLMLIGSCNVGSDPWEEQGVQIASFKEPVRKKESYENMVYDIKNDRMLTYRIPRFALAESVTLRRVGSDQMRLDVLLKEPLPAQAPGWLTIEAHFAAESVDDDPPNLVYFSAPEPLPGFSYLTPGRAVAVSGTGRIIKQIGSTVKDRTVRILFDADLVNQRELFVVVVRYLPKSLAGISISGGFNVAHTDVLRDEYLGSINVPWLPELR